MRTGGKSKADEDDEEDDETTEDADTEPEAGTGSKVKLISFNTVSEESP